MMDHGTDGLVETGLQKKEIRDAVSEFITNEPGRNRNQLQGESKRAQLMRNGLNPAPKGAPVKYLEHYWSDTGFEGMAFKCGYLEPLKKSPANKASATKLENSLGAIGSDNYSAVLWAVFAWQLLDSPALNGLIDHKPEAAAKLIKDCARVLCNDGRYHSPRDEFSPKEGLAYLKAISEHPKLGTLLSDTNEALKLYGKKTRKLKAQYAPKNNKARAFSAV